MYRKSTRQKTVKNMARVKELRGFSLFPVAIEEPIMSEELRTWQARDKRLKGVESKLQKEKESSLVLKRKMEHKRGKIEGQALGEDFPFCSVERRYL